MASNKAKNKKKNVKRNEKNRLAAAEAVAPLLPAVQNEPVTNDDRNLTSFKYLKNLPKEIQLYI